MPHTKKLENLVWPPLCLSVSSIMAGKNLAPLFEILNTPLSVTMDLQNLYTYLLSEIQINKYKI